MKTIEIPENCKKVILELENGEQQVIETKKKNLCS